MAFSQWYELASSPAGDQTPTSGKRHRVGLIPYSALEDLIAWVLPLGDFGRAYPGNAALRASNLHFEPFGGETAKIQSPIAANLDFDTVNTVEYLKVTIDYETIQSDADQGDDPQLLLSHRWSIGGEVIVPSAGGFEWSDGGLVGRDVRPGIIVATIEHQITWARVERPPFTVMRDRLGTVNNATVQFKTGEIATETLMFMGAELNRDILTSGALAWQVGYRFTERRVVGLSINDALTTQVACEAQDGIWNSTTNKCAIKEVGGHNHFYRSEDEEQDDRLEGLTGWYRLRTKPIFDDALATEPACTSGGGTWDSNLGRCVVGGRDPVFRLTGFSDLFQQAP